MDQLEWNEQIQIGVPALDKQNKKLIELANKLIECGSEDIIPREVSDILNQIMDYCVSHFPQEEKYMDEIDFPERLDHKEHHRIFKKKICNFIRSFSETKHANPGEVGDYLVGWIEFHIFYMDTQIRSFQESLVTAEQP